MTVEVIDPAGWRQAVGAEGLLGAFNQAGVIESSDGHVAQRLTALAHEADERVALAVALVVRALRGGSVCVDLQSVEAQVDVPDLPWPAADEWLATMRASPLLGTPPALRIYADNLLYLDRYWREEQQVGVVFRRDASALVARPGTDVDDPVTARDHSHLVFDDDHGVAGFDEPIELGHQLLDV